MSASISYKYMNSYASTQNYKTMTLLIDESIPDPEASCTYADDAVGMPCGFTEEAISAWKEFFNYKPCIMLNGKVLYYLDPNDYRKTETGGTTILPESKVEMPLRDSLSTDNPMWSSEYNMFADVMIEIPRFGIKLSKDNSTITLSITNHPNKSGFQYYAHTFKGKTFEKLYISAFPASAIDVGSTSASVRHLCSNPYICMDEYPDDDYWSYSEDCGQFIRTFARPGGKETLLGFMNQERKGNPNYHMSTYYQYLLIQCMTTIHMKNLLVSDVMRRDTYIQPYYLPRYLLNGGPFWEIKEDDDLGVYSLFGIRGFIASPDMGVNSPSHGYPTKNRTRNIFDGIAIYNNHWYIGRSAKYITDLTNINEYDDCGEFLGNWGYITSCNVGNDIGFLPAQTGGKEESAYKASSFSGLSSSTKYFISNCYNSSSNGFFYSIDVSMDSIAEFNGVHPYNQARIFISTMV